ncbi:MAG: hypothetical protein L3K03_02250 [Thermoplasmata archaeon]|nr:hypothetical protein [Thermoplasmata archaeon]
MPRKWAILGGVAIVAGIVLLFLSVSIQTTPTTVVVPAGQVDTPASNVLGTETLTASWSGGNPLTSFYLVAGTPTCHGTPAGMVAEGSGANGTLSAAIPSGGSYSMYACLGGSGEEITVSWTATGYSPLGVAGGVALVGGAMVLLAEFLSKARIQPPDAPV